MSFGLIKPAQPATLNITEEEVDTVWVELILPYMDQLPLYNQINFSVANDAGTNRALFENRLIPWLACPANPFSQTFTTTEGEFFQEWATVIEYPGAGIRRSFYADQRGREMRDAFRHRTDK